MNLCPMCKKHTVIIMKKKTQGLRHDKPVEYEQESCFCSCLGADDPDAYFETSQMMNENLLRLMQAYEKLYPMSESDIAYKKKLENAVNKKKQPPK